MNMMVWGSVQLVLSMCVATAKHDVTVPQTIDFLFGRTITIIIRDCFCQTGPKLSKVALP